MNKPLDYPLYPMYPYNLAQVDCVRALFGSVAWRHLIPDKDTEVEEKLRYYKALETILIDDLRTPIPHTDKRHGYDPVFRGWFIDPGTQQHRVLYKTSDGIIMSGKIDFKAKPSQAAVEIEGLSPHLGVWDFKTADRYIFNKIDTVHDLIDSKPYIRGHVAQEFIYQYAEGIAGGLIYADRNDWRKKLVPFSYEDIPDFADFVINQVESAWNFIKTGEVPEFPESFEVCEYCPFKRNPCFPPEVNEGVRMDLNTESNRLMLLEMEALRESHERFEDIGHTIRYQVKQDIKANKMLAPKSGYVIGDSHHISASVSDVKEFTVKASTRINIKIIKHKKFTEA